jgi:hypothetical protein
MMSGLLLVVVLLICNCWFCWFAIVGSIILLHNYILHIIILLLLLSDYFVTKIRFHGEELLAPRSNPKLEDHPLSAVRDCLFNIHVFAATLHIGGRSSIRNLRTRHAVVTGTHFSLRWGKLRERDHWRDPGVDGRIILR